MISSSYFPPGTPTPQNGSGNSSAKSDSPSVSDFKSMPVNEMLSSANSRSAFLQSLQRSREREERRERELQNERIKEEYNYDKSSKGSYNTDNSSKVSYLDSTSYNSVNSYTDNSGSYNTSNGSYKSTNTYSAPTFEPSDPYKYYKSDKDSYNKDYNKDYSESNNNQISSPPIMSRRRLSSPKAPNSSSTPLKPQTSSTPVSQSKLASHAFTMSRSSSADEETNNTATDDFKSKYEKEFAVFSQQPSVKNDMNNVLNQTSFAQTPLRQHSNETPVKHSYQSSAAASSSSAYSSDLSTIIESVMEPHVSSLKNDLQNLHIELIKQSVAQQSAFRSLLETYLPLTGKLMDSLKETREENEQLKMRIEELQSKSNRF